MSRKIAIIGLALVLTACGSRTTQPAPTANVPAEATTMAAVTTNIAVASTATAQAAVTTPAPTNIPAAATPLPPSPMPATPAPGTVIGQHTVKEGETLSCMGRAYGVVPSAIAEANGLDVSAVLAVGQVLKIPAVRWDDIPPGPVCAAQFPSPFVNATPPAPTSVPEVILLLEPGSASSVTSPVLVRGQADPTFEQTLVIRITDANGGVLTTVPVQIAADISQRGPFEAQVQFSVSADQPGRISVYSASARDGGLIHLASTEVTLKAGGATTINPVQEHPESIRLDEPAAQATERGGTVHVSGFSEYVFENQMTMVLCGEGGSGEADLICGTKDNVLAVGHLTVNSPDVGQPGPFAGDLAYTITQPVHGRIAVYSSSPRDGGILHLASREIILEP